MKSKLILMGILLFCSTTYSMKRDPDNDSNKRVIKKQKVMAKEFSNFADLPVEIKLIIFEDCILDNIDQSFDDPNFYKLKNKTKYMKIMGNKISKFEFLKSVIYNCNQNIRNCIIAFSNKEIDFIADFNHRIKKNATQYFKTQFVKRLKACISNENIYLILKDIISAGRNDLTCLSIIEHISETLNNASIIDFSLIIQVLLLARTNDNSPKNQKDIIRLQALLNWAMQTEHLPIIHLLIDQEILAKGLYVNNFLWLAENSENINIFRTLSASNDLKEKIIKDISFQLFNGQPRNFARKSYNSHDNDYPNIAPNIAQLLLDFWPLDKLFLGSYSLLIVALYLNDKTAAERSLNSGINIEILNNNQQTALHFVHCLDNEEDAINVAQKILLKGKFNAYDTDKPDRFDLTPIHYAYLKCYIKLAQFLITVALFYIPKPLIVKKYSNSALILLAARNNSLKLLEMVTDKSTIHTRDINNRTPLMIAAYTPKNDIELIILLLTEGADITLMDNNYKSILSYLFKFITKKIANLINNPNDKKKLLCLKEILLKRLDEVKSADQIRPIESVTMFQEFLKNNIN